MYVHTQLIVVIYPVPLVTLTWQLGKALSSYHCLTLHASDTCTIYHPNSVGDFSMNHCYIHRVTHCELVDMQYSQFGYQYFLLEKKILNN